MNNSSFNFSNSFLNRRKFIKNSVTTVGAVLAAPLLSNASGFKKNGDTITVKQIMDMFISEVPGGRLAETVDTLKSGSPDSIVTGIVTTMFATIQVVRKAVDLGANFIIAHEPTFYNHVDDTKWLENDEVYKYKAALLKQHQIVVWRNHDYIHRLVPDGVTIGVLEQLGWRQYADEKVLNVVTVPTVSLKGLVSHAKERLNIEMVRYIGDLLQSVSRLVLIPGAAGLNRHVEAIEKYKPDVLLVGEMSEWETAEYVRDARASGQKVALVVLGHIASEEPGSEYMLNWLKEKVPSVKATHIPCGNSLSFM